MLFTLLVVILFFLKDLSILVFVLLLLVFAVFITWIVWGELRLKGISVSMDNGTITCRGFLGYGSPHKFLFTEFSGYRIASLPNEYEEFEYLYLMIGEKKVIRISEFYHQNYAELKKHIIARAKFIGREPYHFIREIKEMFG